MSKLTFAISINIIVVCSITNSNTISRILLNFSFKFLFMNNLSNDIETFSESDREPE